MPNILDLHPSLRSTFIPLNPDTVTRDEIALHFQTDSRIAGDIVRSIATSQHPTALLASSEKSA